MISDIVRKGHSENTFAKFSIKLIELVEQNLGSSASAKNVGNVIKSQKSLRDFQATTSDETKAEFAPFLRLDAAYYEQCIAEALVVLNKVTA